MRRFTEWLRSWKETLSIKYRTPETYKFLCEYEFDEDDFIEVGPPE
jgi:hypothetical protein